MLMQLKKHRKTLGAFLACGLLPWVSSCKFYPNISAKANIHKQLAHEFNLNNLSQNNLLDAIFLTNLATVNNKLTEATVVHLLSDWIENFLSDNTIDRGTKLYRTQKDLQKTSKNVENELADLIYYGKSTKAIQEQLSPYGGTKKGFLRYKLFEKFQSNLIETIFEKLYLSYKVNDTTYNYYTDNTNLDNPSNWEKIVFYPSDYDLDNANEKYQKMFANFQEYVFNEWFTHERPFIGWNFNWNYGVAGNSSLANVYNADKLGQVDVSIPGTPDFNFPTFNNGSNNSAGDLASYTQWQHGAKTGSLFDNNTGGINPQSVFLTTDPNLKIEHWKLYDNSLIAQEADGYLSSGLVHLYNHLFKNDNSNLVNKINLDSSNDFSSDQKQDILSVFLDTKVNSLPANTPPVSPSATSSNQIGIQIDNTKIFNQNNQKFKNKNFVYPLRDVTRNNKLEWVLVKTKTGVSALTIDGLTKIADKSSLADKNKFLKQALLWRVASTQLIKNSKTKNVLKLDLLAKLKEYATKNFNQLLLSYAIYIQKNDQKITNLAVKSDTLISKDKSFLKNQPQLVALLEILLKYQSISESQVTLTQFRNALAQTVAPLSGKDFVKDSSKNIYYSPYANGLATPLAFTRNLNIVSDDDVFEPKNYVNPAKRSKRSAPVKTNDGDYPELTKFYTDDQINSESNQYQQEALISTFQTLKTKLSNWLNNLKNDNNDLYDNRAYYHLNSWEFNYTYNALLADKTDLQTTIKNLFYANDISFKYQTNELGYNFNEFNLSSIFTNENNLEDLFKTAIQQVIYSDIYTGSVNNINNAKDFIGGFKIDTTNNDNTIASYIKKITSYWNESLYSFNPLGYQISNQLVSNYIRTLFSVKWLLSNNLDNLRTFLAKQIPDHNYGAIVWANEVSMNANQAAGKSQATGSNIKLAQFNKDYGFNPNPNSVLNSPYYSYNLTPTTEVHQDSSSVQNYISAKAPISKSGNTIQYQTLSGFYGFVINKKGFPNNLPTVVNDALFEKFQAANPDGNLTLNNNPSSSSSSDKVKVYGRLFGSNITNVNQGIETIINWLNQVKTFETFNYLANQIAMWFPSLKTAVNQIIQNNYFLQLEQKDGAWVESTSLKRIDLTLKNKIQALKNVLNGHEYKINKDGDNDQLWASISQVYRQEQNKKSGFSLINDNDLKRFIGSLQNPEQQNNIFKDHQFFIPSDDNSRTGYVAYAVQINQEDLSDADKFKEFLKIIGAEAFFKTVVNLAKNIDVQNLAAESFEISNNFKKLQVYDQRLFNVLGRVWAKLID